MIGSTLNVLCVFGMMSAAVAGTVFVERGVDVPQVWQPDRHLYVKGDLGIPRERLDGLAEWLGENAPNWTVLLARNARGESFADAAGERFSGMDAVEHALGKTLPATTAFGELVDPRTGEKNGAFFILFLEERKLAYHASEAYDRRRLGEDHWVGNLDAAAISAMRGGGRVVDAAKDTVTTIDRELSRRIGQEVAQREREAERERRAKEETAASIAEARQRLAELGARLEALRRDFSDPPGDLASAPLALWGTRLDAADRSLAAGDDEAVSLTAAVAADIAGHIRALHEHEAAPVRLRDLRKAFDDVRLHEFSATAREALLAGRAHLQAADEAHQRADSSYLAQISQAERWLGEVGKTDLMTRDSVGKLEALESRAAALGVSPSEHGLPAARRELESGADISTDLERIDTNFRRVEAHRLRSARQREMLKAAMVTGGGLGAAGLLLAGWRGNRRRRAPRKRALELFATWETFHRARSGELLDLLNRTSRAVGSEAALARSGWTGETLRLSERTLADLGQLFVLASGVDRVLEEARAQLFPAGALAAGLNKVSSVRFERALALLAEKPVSFSPDDPLRPILRGQAVDEPRLLAEGTRAAETFTLTFRELNEAFRERAAGVMAGLEFLESCWSGAERSLAELDAALTEAEEAERRIHETAQEDGRFGISGVFEKLLPAAREDQNQAATRAATDPVGALADEIPRGVRRAADAAGLCAWISRFREVAMPSLDKRARELESRGRETGWIGEALDELSMRMDALAEQAVEISAADGLRKLSADADALTGAAAAASEFAERAAESCGPSMDEARRRVAEERERLGRLLGLTPEEILRESAELDPDRTLERAAGQHAAALAAIDRGDVTAALHALDACDRYCRVVHEVLEATVAAFGQAAAESARLDEESERVAALVPAAAAVLAELERDWAASALRPFAADPAYPEAGASVSDFVKQANRLLDRSRRTAVDSRDRHRSGRILEAAEMRSEAAASCGEAERFLVEIHSHAEAIQAAVESNRAAAADLRQRSRQLAEAVTAAHATRPTQDIFELSKQSSDTACAAGDARGAAANPFEAAKLLADASAALEAVDDALRADRRHHEEAARSLNAAASELDLAGQLARRSQTDGIPDSPETTRCLSELEEWTRTLADARQTFAVPHCDWQELSAGAERIAAGAACLAGRLRGELDLAERAVREMEAARARVRAATTWGGMFGSAGAADLEQARSMLSSGDYGAASRFAAASLRAADLAIRQAEAEALRRRREAERRREAARRHRSNISFGSSSSSSGFGSRSSFGSSSGSSRSSFSSGSGTRRSGW